MPGWGLGWGGWAALPPDGALGAMETLKAGGCARGRSQLGRPPLHQPQLKSPASHACDISPYASPGCHRGGWWSLRAGRWLSLQAPCHATSSTLTRAPTQLWPAAHAAACPWATGWVLEAGVAAARVAGSD
jgi:hypothetical protein